MDIDFSEDPCEVTFISQCNRNEDHVDRAIKTLKELQRQNDAVRGQMDFIKANPKAFIKPARDSLSMKINALREENDMLRRMIEKTKIPTYTEMTKKKIVNQQNGDNSPFKQSLRGSFRPRNPLEEIDSNADKNDERSTCLNFGQSRMAEGRFVVGPNDEESRRAMVTEIRLLLQKADAFQEELQRIHKRESRGVEQCGRRDEATQRQLQQIYEYKKKLVKLLSKLKSRELAMTDMVKAYRAMHEQTLERLVQATRALEALQMAEVSEDVDERYAEVLQLQQRLGLIDRQLQEMDEGRWLQQIASELSAAVRRMGLEVPKVGSTRQLIDQLCELLIESHIVSRKDGQQKLNMLKHYHEQEKKNNSKYIMGLKAKEQALGRKLIDLQMER